MSGVTAGQWPHAKLIHVMSNAWNGHSPNFNPDCAHSTYNTRDHDPAALFNRADQHISSIKASSRDSRQQDILASTLEDAAIHSLFGSNSIEYAGLSWGVTAHLCREVFAGSALPEPDDETSNSILDKMRTIDPDCKRKRPEGIHREQGEEFTAGGIEID